MHKLTQQDADLFRPQRPRVGIIGKQDSKNKRPAPLEAPA